MVISFTDNQFYWKFQSSLHFNETLTSRRQLDNYPLIDGISNKLGTRQTCCLYLFILNMRHSVIDNKGYIHYNAGVFYIMEPM